MKTTLRIATRKSALAMWQARHVRGLLQKQWPDLDISLLPITTQGDRIVDRPLAAIGGKGLFLKELEHALIAGEADIAVHSMKDVPAEMTAGLAVDVVLKRANPFDALVSRHGELLEQLPAGARVGTSSLRRQCQLLAARPDLKVQDLRGNVDTRLRRLDEGHYDAIILACAGLQRLGLGKRISQQLTAPDWLPASTQGTIGIQCRVNDPEVQSLLAPLHDAATGVLATAERSVARRLEGSCQLPLAVFAQMEAQLQVSALVGMPDGSDIIRASQKGSAEDPEALGLALADEMLALGAARIIDLTR